MASEPLRRYDTGTSSWVGVAAGSVSDGISEYGVNQMGLASLSRQALINGNFDVWQRGTSFVNPANGAYGADRWVTSYNTAGGTLPTSITHSKQSINPGDLNSSIYYYRINVNGSGSGYGATAEYVLRQLIENGTRLLAGTSKKVTVSFWARSSIANKKIGIKLFQYYGAGGSPSAVETISGNKWTLTPTWTKYTFTFNLNTLSGKTFGTNVSDALGFDIQYVWGTTTSTTVGDTISETFVGSGTIDIAQVQICSGESAMSFQPRSPSEELMLCQRYYSSYNFGFLYSYSLGTSYRGRVVFPVTMRTIPTVTTTPFTGSTISVVEGITNSGFNFGGSVPSILESYTADAEI